MYGKLPMYQNIGGSAYKKDLINITKLSEYLNNPHNSFKSVHIAGTNGKGSTAHMIASILQEGKYKVGLYTSPHLKDFRERIKINGKMINKDFVSDFILKNMDFFNHNSFSFFEMTVGMAFEYFKKNSVDIAIIETGMGGRLDSTNIISPELSVITNVSMDHVKFLGNTIEDIAIEKAGIIKSHIPVVIGEKQNDVSNVFINKAEEKKSKIFFAEDFNIKEYECELKGSYQKKNIKTAIVAIELLNDTEIKINEKNIIDGLNKIIQNTGIRGRWEIIGNKPLIICDVAHNIDALSIVINDIISIKSNKIHFVLGFVNDKNLDSIVDIFPESSNYYFAKPNIERGLDELELQELFKNNNRIGESYSSIEQAFKSAIKQSDPNDVIYIGGSTFVVSEVI
ncbi:MAG: Mur ligase family protein [Bacteroidota bacterium]|nr:Mur ligase family protein [Bacteroidota bacterium]